MIRNPPPASALVSTADRGVALIAALVILTLLLAIATFFSFSMRTHERQASVSIEQSKASQSVRSALEAAEAALAATDPARDSTPQVDSAKELAPDLYAKLGPFGADTNNPQGTIASVRATDEQGKVDVNRSSPLFLGNLLSPARLVGSLDDSEEKTLTVSSTEGLPDNGIVWIDGELILYQQKTARALLDLKRAFDTTVLKSLPRSEHSSGRPAIDYRVILAAVYPYKSDAIADGGFGGFTTVRALKDIGRFGELGFTTTDVERFESDLTTYASIASGDRFGPEVRAVGAYTPNDHPLPIEVSGARNVNSGTVVRLRAGDRVEYNLVVAADEIGPSRLSIMLQEPPRYDYRADELMIAPLLRAPLNVNACSQRVLTALLVGLKLRGDPEAVSADAATLLASRIVKARPVQGEPGLAKLLRDLMADEATKQIVTPQVAAAVFFNANNALDTRLETSTAPFCYRSYGTLTLEAAASENLSAGRESGRAFATEVVQAAPGGASTTIFTEQIDFQEPMRLSRQGRGWTTWPMNVHDLDSGNEPPVPLLSYLRYGRYPAVSSEEQIALAAAGEEPSARLKPVAKDGQRDPSAEGAPRVLHLDEPAVAKPGAGASQGDVPPCDDPDGWNIADRGPKSLLVAEPMVNLIGVNEYVQPFCIDLWWKPGEGEGEHYIFDTGETELSNRIFAYFDGTKLVFRVADTTVPDYEASAADWPTTMAEIQYAFDDGLPFERDVPYHLTFYARGTDPCDMVLLVDNVPRGRRAFSTILRKSIGPVQVYAGPLSKVKGYGQGKGETIEVVDASLFPAEGVLRVGDELIEYTSKDDAKRQFVVSSTPGQPFGGRARRGTYADAPQSVVKQGQQQAVKVPHQATETIELYGYAAPLASKQLANGDSTLTGPLGRFAVAMVDPTAPEAKQAITLLDRNGNPIQNVKPTGLTAAAVRIPLTGLAKVATTSGSGGGGGGVGGSTASAFSKNGGFALLVSSPRPPPSTSTGQVTIQVQQPGGGAQTQTVTVDFGWWNGVDTTNGRLGRIEMISYSDFDGVALTGVGRAGGAVAGGKWEPQSNLAKGTGSAVESEIVGIAHDHVVGWPTQWVDMNKYVPSQPIYVIPISVKAGSTSGGGSTNQWAIPEVAGGGGGKGGKGTQSGMTMPEMIQIGLGFQGGASGGTEWVRYDTMSGGSFVRDNPNRLEPAGELVGHYLTYLYTLKDGTPPSADLVARAVNFENIEANQEEKEEILKEIGVGAGTDGFANFASLFDNSVGLLAFRGVLGTGTRDHPGGDRVLPVFRTVRGGDPDTGRPGARDFVTLVDPKNNAREEHRINFGYCEPDAEGWGWLACHVGLDAGVDGTFASDFWEQMQAVDPDDSDAGMAELANQALESRQVARMLKFPSGELPLELGEEIHFGGDLAGAPSPAGGTIDEIEFFTPLTPDPLFRNHQFILDYFDEKAGEIWVYAHWLRDPARKKGGPAIEVLDPANQLPKDGLVLQIGHEMVGVKSYRFEEASTGELSEMFAVFEVAEGGRGFFGTPIQAHPRGEGVRELTFLRVSRLAKGLDADENVLLLDDTTDFADQGTVVLGRELMGYTRKQAGNVLFMPPWKDPSGRDVGLLRGSYGTAREKHREDELAVQFHVRHLDRYRELADDPELGALAITLPQRRAFYKGASWSVTGESERAKITVEARVGGRGKWTDAPGDNPDRFTFMDGADTGTVAEIAGRGHEILRQGDVLELRIFTRYLDGAFDSRVFEPDPGEERGGRNDWKRAPHLKALGVDWIGTPARLAYEEWR